MKKDRMRVGTYTLANLTAMDKVYDLLFGSVYDLVHIPDFYPWQLVNGTWTGVLGHLMNDMQIGRLNASHYFLFCEFYLPLCTTQFQCSIVQGDSRMGFIFLFIIQ
jgi:hypothetical protein